MVNSILNPEINYPEIKKLDSDDTDYDASLYETNVLGIDIIIALGQAKYTFIDKNIIYFPIYLVKNDRVVNQLGLYEIMESQFNHILIYLSDLLIKTYAQTFVLVRVLSASLFKYITSRASR